MIKLFSLKGQQKDGSTGANARSGMGPKKASAAQLRITKGLRILIGIGRIISK